MMSLKNDLGHEKAPYCLYIYPQLSNEVSTVCTVLATKELSASEVIKNAVSVLGLDSDKHYVLAEVKESGGEEWVLGSTDSPVQRVLLWPRKAQDRHQQSDGYYFLLQEKDQDGSIKYAHLPLVSEEEESRRLMERGFLPRLQVDYNDLCSLPKLTEDAILDNLKSRFLNQKIYTYAGSILIAINPFKFLPIYNPKYVKMYDNHQLGKLEPHIFAIADVSYHTMLKKRVNQCIVISGESGSGKTQSTNFLIHCLTALSQKGHASGVERTILGAGPVLEAFGNAKTAHNNNSSRFGKFIQVNYLESGIVRGAVVEKYLLEKSRLVSQEKNERNYHVFYYLLLGASEEERKEFKLKQPEDYFYLNQNNFKVEEGEDLRHDFERLKQAMEMVGFYPATKKQIFSVLSAILYLGNVTYKKKSSGRDEGLDVGPPEVLDTLSQILQVKREMLVEALTKRKTVTVNEKLILPYSLNEAITARDSMAKSLYSALFDWIVLRINHALLNRKDVEESVNCLSIGVLDIFGFEDFENNSFEQFCINYANEQLQYYFNQHIFKLEQEEYKGEGITWHNIDYTDNVGCIQLISKKPTGLFYLLDEESNFPHATNRTLLAKFKQQHEGNKYFVATPVMEPAFIIRHFAGKVKYQIKDFREKNTDYMRPDIVALLRSSDSGYIRELIGMDPVSVFRWAVLRAAIRSMAVLNEAARQRAERTAGVNRTVAKIPMGELQRSNNPMEKLYRERHCELMSSIKGLSWQGDDPAQLLQRLSLRRQSRLHLQKTKNLRQKQVIPKNPLDSQSLKLIMSMTLHDRTTKSLLHLHKKKKPPSISAQFQTSLNKLLETLGKAEPFFIRCIRSNAEKMEMRFDEALVLQQLRYTGMLETVRIRRSGYSAKYTYKEFVDHFQVLLPKLSPVPKNTIATLLESMCLDPRNYQLGKTKVFMKEPEREMLQDALHQAVIKKIILLQSLFRMVVEKRNFLRMKIAAVTIQACWRSHCVRQDLEQKRNAAVCIQALWRGCAQRRSYEKQIQIIKKLQALCKGHLQRKRYKEMLEEKHKAAEEEERRRKQEALERERVALLKQAQKEEEQKKKQEEMKREAELREKLISEKEKEIIKSNIKTVIYINEGQKEEMYERGVAGQQVNSGDIALERIVKENERNNELKEEGTIESGNQVPNMELVSNIDKILQTKENQVRPVPQRNDSGSPERAASCREKRENRRRRGLQHDLIQNKHIYSSIEEPEKEQGALQKEDEIVTKDNAKLEEVENQQETSNNETPVTNTRLSRAGDDVQANKQDQTLEKPTRPADLPLNSQVSISKQLPTPEERSRPSESRKEEGVPSAGIVQRYSDHERLKNIAEKWKERRQNEAAQMESGRTTEKEEAKLPERKNATPSAEIPADVQPPSPIQTSSMQPEQEKGAKKQPAQKKKSNEQNSHSESAQAQSTDSKHTYKSPLYRLLGRKPEKKNSKEAPPTPENVEEPPFLQHTQEVTATKRTIDGNAASGQNSRTYGVEPVNKIHRRRSIKISKATTVSEKWKASLYREINNPTELKHLDDFLFAKFNTFNSDKSGVENLLFEAVKMFRANLKSMYSSPNGQIHAGYKDLMENFQILVGTLTQEREEKDVKLVLNLFQSFLDEFTRGYCKKEDSEPQKPRKSQKKKRKQDQTVEIHGHVFISYQVNIGQSCEHCSNTIWPMEKACLCSTCKMVCHKKCLTRIQNNCSSIGGGKNLGSHQFGVHVADLTNDTNSVPVVMEILLEYLEIHGLYTEGIYRKSGAANRMRELKESLEKDPSLVKLDNYPIHAITGILKQWLRELPEPLMTFAQYNEFLRAVELPGKQEQLCAIYKVIGQLPHANYNTLERLIFHLVMVAMVEEVNRMSPNSLAIVFAPCILRCPDNYDPLTSMKEIAKTTTCVEMLIKEQMRHYKIKMQEIGLLEAAEIRAVTRLSLLRNTTSKSQASNGKSLPDLDVVQEEHLSDSETARESQILLDRIKTIKEEKEDITYRLPELEQRGSDEENMDSETSNSTESLLDEKLSKAEKEAVPAFNPSLAPSDNLQAQAPLFAMSVNQTSFKRRPSSFLAKMRGHRKNPVMPTSNIKLPPGLIKSTDAAEESSSVRRREQPGRRTDNIQSVYVPEGTEMGTVHRALEYEPTAKLKRRFSDPHLQIPCPDESSL
ncbi:unconventional myosin-IXb isoform X4 [Xenopus tropicalis]|uniref:Unconventional myosin-IXb isoform X4 n=1 Tax=Xenopus tropicalis TaxID=8364 RepID=A0A8J0T438_XENTR|nr:unconventional myosin-IXb isoform X4 [Xenopus tropicalis]|eukprot:XP_017953136.1 PREDICTED: unconventional myosin-IXb isoform X4 [Xenopus tropicalis]